MLRDADLPPVFVCTSCGRGFLTAQPYNLDQYPLWKQLDGQSSGTPCNGSIRLLERRSALALATGGAGTPAEKPAAS
jgi:hypothetical protein